PTHTLHSSPTRRSSDLEHSESNGTDDQPGPYQRPWAHPAREYWDHHGAHDERGHRGHRRQPCLQWRKTQHELQVLRDEDVRSKRDRKSTRLNSSHVSIS